MKKRKLPIVLCSVLVVLLGGVFFFNVFNQQTSEETETGQTSGKDPGKAVGNDTKDISQAGLQASVASTMKKTMNKPTGKLAGQAHHIRQTPDDNSVTTTPMVMRQQGQVTSRKPSRRPNDAEGTGQWYTDASSVKGG